MTTIDKYISNTTKPELTLKKQAFMIEQFVNGVSIHDLAKINGLSFESAKEICMKWYSKGSESITIPSIAVNSDRQQFIKAYTNVLNEKTMAEALGVSTGTVRRSSIGLHIARKKSVYSNPMPFHYLKVSIILNQETGIYYFSAAEAADTLGKSDHWLRNRIVKMIARNNTSFVYCGPYK